MRTGAAIGIDEVSGVFETKKELDKVELNAVYSIHICFDGV